MYISTTRYHPSIISNGSFGSRACSGWIATVADRCTNPPVLNRTNASPASVLNSKLVCQKLVVARILCPSGNSSVPPPIQVSFLNVAMSKSDPQDRTVTLGCQNPTRFNVQQPSGLSAVANVPNELLKRRVALSSSPARNSYSIFQARGCTHSSSRPTTSAILFTAFQRAGPGHRFTLLDPF
jgi:hypothetical protein